MKQERLFVDDGYELPSDTFMLKRIASMFNDDHEYKKNVYEVVAKRASWVRNLKEHDMRNIQAAIAERVNHHFEVHGRGRNKSSLNLYNILSNVKDFFQKLGKYKLSLTNKECNFVFEVITFSAMRAIAASVNYDLSEIMSTKVFSRVERDESIVFPDKLIIESRKDVLNVAQMSELEKLKEHSFSLDSTKLSFENHDSINAVVRIDSVIELCQELMRTDLPNESEIRMLRNISSKHLPEIKLQFERCLVNGSKDAVSELFNYALVQCGDVESFIDYIKTRDKANILR